MSLYLSKLIPALLYPVSLTFWLVLFALLARKKPKLKLGLLIAAVLILVASGNRWTAFSLARSLEWKYPPQETTPHADVIVVLGGGTAPDFPPRQMVEVVGAGDRVLYAAKLYKEGAAPYLLLSGGRLDWEDQSSSPAEQMYDLFLFIDIPPEAMWLESESRNTYENALYAYELLQDKDIDKIILVTSAMHMPRAVKLFEAQGFEVIPAPTDFTVTYSDWRALFNGFSFADILYLIPGASSISLTTNVLKEYIGILYYTMRGWK